MPGLLAGAVLPTFASAASDDHERLGYTWCRVFEAALIVGAWSAVTISGGVARMAIDGTAVVARPALSMVLFAAVRVVTRALPAEPWPILPGTYAARSSEA